MEEKEEEKEKKKEIVADRRADIEGSINGPRESKKLNLSCCEIPEPKVRGGPNQSEREEEFARSVDPGEAAHQDKLKRFIENFERIPHRVVFTLALKFWSLFLFFRGQNIFFCFI